MGQKKVSISSHGVQNMVSLFLDNHYFSPGAGHAWSLAGGTTHCLHTRLVLIES